MLLVLMTLKNRHHSWTSDVRYKAKGKVPAGASEEEKRKIFLQILGASPAPAVVKAMAKDKLLGEEVVIEKIISSMPKKPRKLGLKTAAKKLTDLDTKLQNLDKNKIKQKAKDIFIGKSAKGTAVRAAGLAGAAYLGGRKDEADFGQARNIEVGALKKAGFRPETPIKPLTSRAMKYEETMLEDKKMSKQSDDALAAAHKKLWYGSINSI